MAVTGNIRASIALTNTLAGVDLSTPSEQISESVSKQPGSGCIVYHDELSIATGVQSSLNVGDDSLSDVYGNTVAMVGIQGIYVEADSDNAGDVFIGSATGVQSAIQPLPALSAGEAMSIAADIDVNTNAVIYITNGAATAALKIVIVGTEIA